ncbi:hypothetical protein [Methylobacterium oryzae]|uniref:hypothetical protein n=1 Tax=Methylobacterium oryzae TaxID=334852 RepID=UPI001F19C130|nr:hypothetical protein [Methylobacterium oryzae]UIN34005.1 hypothetical protein LXM90_23445 [Methylobacterium oryzae]
MTDLGRKKRLSARAASAITASVFLMIFSAIELAPLWINRNDHSPDRSQNKCDPILNQIQDPRKTIRPNDDLKIIRLTNSGEFVSRCDLTNVLYELNWDKKRPAWAFGPSSDDQAPHLPKLALLYIHGWKHSADKDDDDLKHFSRLVENLRDKYRDHKRVVGIYVGWNASADFWSWASFLENTTFWVKKNNADRIAQSAAVTMIVSAVGSATKKANNPKDQFIAIGHSFGARLLYSATAQSLVTAAQQAHPGYPTGTYSRIEGVANAVILLNPAFEASRYSIINDFTRNEERFLASQPPLLITVSSRGDLATRDAFPLGQWLGLARSEREKTTLGNYRPFVTHALERSSKEKCAHVDGDGAFENNFSANFCLRRISPQQESITNYKGGGSIQYNNPFIVAQTDETIIKDHNDIWNDDFTSWMTEIIQGLEQRHELVPGAQPESDAPSISR